MVDLSNISDRELLDRRFWLSADEDPATLPNLLARVRTGETESLIFEHAYDRSPPPGVPRPFVRCAHCGAARHYRGYVLRYPDSFGVLIGKDCGEASYDLWWTKNEAEFQDRVVRGATLQRMRTAVAMLPAIVAELQSIKSSGALDAAIQTAEQFRRRFPTGCEHLLGATNGRFMAMQDVRDYDAERQRDDRIDRIIARRADRAGIPQEQYERERRAEITADPELQKPPLYREEMREIAVIRSHQFFVTALSGAREKWDAGTDGIEETFTRFSGHIAGLESRDAPLTTDELVREMGQLRRQLEQARSLRDTLSEGPAFFDPANMQTIARALMHVRSGVGTYSVENGVFVLTAASGHRAEYPVSGITLPTLDRTRELVRALTTTA